MADIIVGGIVLLVIGAATFYIIKAKKSGVKCIGCPAARQCASHKATSPQSTECGCGCRSDAK